MSQSLAKGMGSHLMTVSPGIDEDGHPLEPPRWGWPRFARLLTQGCAWLVSLAALHPGLA